MAIRRESTDLSRFSAYQEIKIVKCMMYFSVRFLFIFACLKWQQITLKRGKFSDHFMVKQIFCVIERNNT